MTSLDRWISVHYQYSSLVRAGLTVRGPRRGPASPPMPSPSLPPSRPGIRPTPSRRPRRSGLRDTISRWGLCARRAACVSVIAMSPGGAGRGGIRRGSGPAESARRRQSFDSARDWLMTILNDRSTPTNLVPAAYFALGRFDWRRPGGGPAAAAQLFPWPSRRSPRRQYTIPRWRLRPWARWRIAACSWRPNPPTATPGRRTLPTRDRISLCRHLGLEQGGLRAGHRREAAGG